MRRVSVLARLAAAGVVATALGSCVTAKGAPWPETLAKVGSPAPKHARIVFLRPDQRYDDASAQPDGVLRVDDRDISASSRTAATFGDVPGASRPRDIRAKTAAAAPASCRCNRGRRNDVLRCRSAPANIAAGTAGAVLAEVGSRRRPCPRLPGGDRPDVVGGVAGRRRRRRPKAQARRAAARIA